MRVSAFAGVPVLVVLWTAALPLKLGDMAYAAAPGKCSPSILTNREAQALALGVPVALEAGSPGLVDAEEWTPAGGRGDLFFFYMLLARSRELPVIGYYAVNKRTADVVDFVLQREVYSQELANLQRQLRKRHCITSEVIRKNSTLALHDR